MLLVLAISAGAPLLPRKLMTLGREGYVFSLAAKASLAPIFVGMVLRPLLAGRADLTRGVTEVILSV